MKLLRIYGHRQSDNTYWTRHFIEINKGDLLYEG